MFHEARFILHRNGLKKSTSILKVNKESVRLHPNFINNQEPDSGYDIALALVELDEGKNELPYVYPEPRAFTSNHLINSNWNQIRHIPLHFNQITSIPASLSSSNMDDDKLSGTESCGDEKDDTRPWAIKFNEQDCCRLKVESFDK